MIERIRKKNFKNWLKFYLIWEKNQNSKKEKIKKQIKKMTQKFIVYLHITKRCPNKFNSIQELEQSIWVYNILKLMQPTIRKYNY